MRHLLPLLKDVLPARLRRGAGVALLAWCGGALAQGGAAPAPYKLRVVGGLAGVNQYLQHEEPFWTQQLARLSEGRYSADIVPFDRAGVPGAEMLRLMQLGVLPFGTVLVSALAAQYQQYAAADLPGIGTDMAGIRAASALTSTVPKGSTPSCIRRSISAPGTPARSNGTMSAL